MREAGLFDLDSETYQRARLVLARHGRVPVNEPIGPVICARELLLAMHTDPADTRELLDTAALLLEPACYQPDPHSYGAPHEDLDSAYLVSLGDARLWLGIVEWLRGSDFESPLRASAKTYFAASSVPTFPGTIVMVPSAKSLGGRDLLETKAARALSEFVAGTIRLGRPSLDTRVEADVATATHVFERHGQHERASGLLRVLQAGESGFVSEVCGFLRNQGAGIEPVLATRDAYEARIRYVQSTRPSQRESIMAAGFDEDLTAAWHPDPLGRYEYRYWDGQRWTGHVGSQGIAGLDAIGPELSAPAAQQASGRGPTGGQPLGQPQQEPAPRESSARQAPADGGQPAADDADHWQRPWTAEAAAVAVVVDTSRADAVPGTEGTAMWQSLVRALGVTLALSELEFKREKSLAELELTSMHWEMLPKLLEDYTGVRLELFEIRDTDTLGEVAQRLELKHSSSFASATPYSGGQTAVNERGYGPDPRRTSGSEEANRASTQHPRPSTGQVVQVPPAGWYADYEESKSTQRWWDGATWTRHTRPTASEKPDEEVSRAFAEMGADSRLEQIVRFCMNNDESITAIAEQIDNGTAINLVRVYAIMGTALAQVEGPDAENQLWEIVTDEAQLRTTQEALSEPRYYALLRTSETLNQAVGEAWKAAGENPGAWAATGPDRMLDGEENLIWRIAIVALIRAAGQRVDRFELLFPAAVLGRA